VLRGDGRVSVERRVLHGDVHRRAVCPELRHRAAILTAGDRQTATGLILGTAALVQP